MLCCTRRRRPPPACVLITGAGGAFGRALALRFAREGCALALVDVSAAALDGTRAALAAAAAAAAAGELGGGAPVAALLCDVSDEAAVAALPARVRAAGLPAVAVVVSNAAVARGPAARVLAVNAAASAYLAAAFLPPPEGTGTAHTLVLIASIMATVGAAGMGAYCASKWALLGLADSTRLSLQAAGRGADVDVICVLPHVSSEGDMFRGIFSGPRNAGVAACARGLFPPVTPVQVADAVAAAVLAGGSSTFSIPAPMLGISLVLRCCLPQCAHDAVTGWLGGWYGTDGWQQAQQAAQAAQAQQPPAVSADAASRRPLRLGRSSSAGRTRGR